MTKQRAIQKRVNERIERNRQRVQQAEGEEHIPFKEIIIRRAVVDNDVIGTMVAGSPNHETTKRLIAVLDEAGFGDDLVS